MPPFREEQTFSPWVYWLLAVTAGAAFSGPLVALWLAQDASSAWAAIPVEGFVALVILLPLNLLFMSTNIADGEVIVRFGRWVTLYRKRIRTDGITEVRSVYYNPLWDAGGWGIRWGRFEGKRCAFLNARGDRGVFVVYASGKRLLIGSQEPERLAEALRKSAGLPA